MGLEIERKWLIKNLPDLDDFEEVDKHVITQGYLFKSKYYVIRVRTSASSTGKFGIITYKGPSGIDGATDERELEIPYDAALCLIGECDTIIQKYRFTFPYEDLKIELDVFNGNHQGLIIAEVEFKNVGDPFTPPVWFGKEVTDDKRYSNANLCITGSIPIEL